jgi:maltoporin
MLPPAAGNGRTTVGRTKLTISLVQQPASTAATSSSSNNYFGTLILSSTTNGLADRRVQLAILRRLAASLEFPVSESVHNSTSTTTSASGTGGAGAGPLFGAGATGRMVSHVRMFNVAAASNATRSGISSDSNNSSNNNNNS